MRKGEILSLKKSDIVLGDLGGYISLKDTKNGDNRKVFLTVELTEFLKNTIEDNPYGEYVFSDIWGKELVTIHTSWEGTCKRAGIKDLKFHDLRHTFCTRMAHLGVSPFTIMQVVGHKDTKTARRYTNPTDEHMLSAMSKVSRQFSRQQEKNELTVKTNDGNNKAMLAI